MLSAPAAHISSLSLALVKGSEEGDKEKEGEGEEEGEPEDRIREIASAVGSNALTVLLTQETRADRVIEQHAHCGTGAIQLVDVFEGDYADLGRRSGAKVIQVVHVRDERDM